MGIVSFSGKFESTGISELLAYTSSFIAYWIRINSENEV
jgi:hypothetical protein